MRLWSIHPKYLDPQGLVALWREGLLAKKVLSGMTKGYRKHPQLIRFYRSENPIEQINAFLVEIFNEAVLRGYKFDKTKIKITKKCQIPKINVNWKQVEYEFSFLQEKLKNRNQQKYLDNQRIEDIEVNGKFKIVDGEIEEWEKVKIAKSNNIKK